VTPIGVAPERTDLDARATAALLAVVLLVAAALRLAFLDAVPPGLHTDEAHNALDAWAIAGGWRPAFLPGNNGREPLFMYVMAAVMAVVGPSILAVRLTGAIAGITGVAATFLTVRALPLARPRRTALLASAYLATTLWPVAQARTAIRAGLLPVFSALFLLAWWRVVDPGEPLGARGLAAAPIAAPFARSRLLWAALAGAAIGAALLTHLTGRILPLVVVASTAAVLVQPAGTGRRRRDVLGSALVALAVAGAMASPMIRHFAAHPDQIARRLDQVRLVGAAPVEDGPQSTAGAEPLGPVAVAGALAGSAGRLLLATVVRGDRLWYHNVKQRPVWTDWPSVLAFLAGSLVVARMLTRRARPRERAAAVLVVLFLGAMAAPSWLSAGAPNFFRLTGTWPVLFLLPALGLDAGMAWAGDRWRGRRGMAAGALAALALGALTATTVHDYFVQYARRPEVAAAFDADAVARGRQLAALVQGGPTWTSPLVARQSILRLAVLPETLAVFDPAVGLVLPASGDGRYALDPLESSEAARLLAAWPGLEREAATVPTPVRAFGQGPLAARPGAIGRGTMGTGGPAPLQILRLPHSAASLLGGRTLPAMPRFGRALRLVRSSVAPEVVPPGGTVTATLAFDVLAPTERDVNLFVHAIGVGRTIAQHDGPPLGAGDPTDRWRAGTRVVIAHPLAVAGDASPGPVAVQAGLYDWRDGVRLAVEGDDDGAVAVGAFRVANASPP